MRSTFERLTSTTSALHPIATRLAYTHIHTHIYTHTHKPRAATTREEHSARSKKNHKRLHTSAHQNCNNTNLRCAIPPLLRAARRRVSLHDVDLTLRWISRRAVGELALPEQKIKTHGPVERSGHTNTGERRATKKTSHFPTVTQQAAVTSVMDALTHVKKTSPPMRCGRFLPSLPYYYGEPR